LKRSFNNPFRDNTKHIIVHTAHHKVGTSWFVCVLRHIGEEFGLPFVKNDISQLPKARPAIFFQNRINVRPASFSSYRGSHMIRDPRDIVLSAYNYHLWTDEKWVNKPIKDLPADMSKVWSLLPINQIKDMTYKEYLNSLSREEGILAEMKRVSTTTIKEIVEWNYLDPNIIEFKYEDIMQNEDDVFRKLFTHYGFKEDDVEKAVKVAEKCSFNKRSKREVGEVDNKSHLRSGKLRQWEEEYNADHVACFKELHGQDLIHLGYEKDLNW